MNSDGLLGVFGFFSRSLDQSRARLCFNPHLEKDARLWEATRRFGELSHEIHLRWLDEIIAMVEEQW
jgi:hypothetical protein